MPVEKRKLQQRNLFYSKKNEFLDLSRYLCYKRSVERAENYTPDAWQLFDKTRVSTRVREGELRMRRVEEVLRGMFPNGRYEFQIKLHSQILRAVLKQILREDYNDLVEKICRERNWDGPKKNLFTIASRRSGKTTGMASLVATLLICIPELEIVVYSVGLRTAKEFVRLTEGYVSKYPGGERMIYSNGAEQLMLKGPTGEKRRLRSFPSGGNAKNVSRIIFIQLREQLSFFFSPTLSFYRNISHMSLRDSTLLENSGLTQVAGVNIDTDSFAEEEQEKLSKDLLFLQAIADEFVARKTEWNLMTVFGEFQKVSEKITSYEKKHGKILVQSFVPCAIMPHILVYISNELEKMLPKEQRLKSEFQNAFFQNLLHCYSPNRFQTPGHAIVVSLEDLCLPAFDHHFDRTLDDDSVDTLKELAQAYLDSDYNLDEATATRCQEIVHGHLPNGFNTFTEQRWVTEDLRWRLYPLKSDPHEAEREAQLNYLKRSAEELEELTDDQLKPHLEELKKAEYKFW